MKQLLSFLLLSFLLSSLGRAQEYNFERYSYADLFRMIEEETDSVFTLNNALINFNPDKDKAIKPEKIYDVIYCGLISEVRGIYQIIERSFQ